ncbi:MAG: iron-containing alcohol dehydrogenase [Dethiobacter sp.]|jgi:alcohol dehydrogenase YqhD (iron-dependent ADH family)|nr:iron-containing alcohol dehydrogenase [Dethiobacter sp.]
MDNFGLYIPTRIIFGQGEMDKLGVESSKYGTKALLVKTVGPLEKMGVYARATKLMEDAGITVFELNDVEANPKLSSVYEGNKICKENNIDIVIAVGGGSAIDCAKAIALAATDDGDVWDFFENKRTAQKALPVGTVSTIASTGAEMSLHCVITNSDTKRKLVTHYDFSYPKFSIIDPELHATVPKYLTACGMADTISHVMESYFVNEKQPLSDRIAEGVVLTVLESESILSDLGNIDMRADLAWAAVMAINGITDAGRGNFLYGAHEIAHGVSAVVDSTHGAALAVLHPAWLSYLCKKDEYPAKFIQFAQRIFGIQKSGKNSVELGLEAIDALKEKYISWGMPGNLRELGVKEEHLEEIAVSTVDNPIGPLKDKEEVLQVLRDCF